MSLTTKQFTRAQEIISELTQLQHELFGLGLVGTAMEMAKVTQRIGWELAEKLDQNRAKERTCTPRSCRQK